MFDILEHFFLTFAKIVTKNSEKILFLFLMNIFYFFWIFLLFYPFLRFPREITFFNFWQNILLLYIRCYILKSSCVTVLYISFHIDSMTARVVSHCFIVSWQWELSPFAPLSFLYITYSKQSFGCISNTYERNSLILKSGWELHIKNVMLNVF
jgi:hypothetical protein